MRPYQFLFLAVVFVFSCKTVEDNFDTDLGHGYMALEVGKFIEYEVDSTIFDPTGDSLVNYYHSYLRDIIVDTLRDNIGELLYKTERFYRKSSAESWQIQKVFTQSIQGNQGIVTEDNLRFIKLAFPVQVSNTWNPLVHIDPFIQIIVAGETLEPFKDGNWRTRILSTDEPDTLNGFAFDEVLTLREVNTGGYTFDESINRIVENNNPNDPAPLIELRNSYEKYANGVGLVFRERWILDSQKCFEDCQPLKDLFDNCVNQCLATGTTDTILCELNCDPLLVDYEICVDQCNALPWEQKAQKGFIMRMSVIAHN